MTKLRISLQLLLLGLLWSSCGSVKRVSDLSYQDRKRFDQAYFEAAKQKLLQNTDRSIVLFQQALNYHPNSHAAMYQLGGLYFNKKQYPEAEEWSLKAVETAKTYNHWYAGQLAQVYYTNGKYLEAAHVFEQMIANEPMNGDLYLQAVNQYLNGKKVEIALKTLDRMESVLGVSEPSATKKEYIYLNIGEGELAVGAIQKLVDAYPDQAIYRGFLAETLINTGQKDRAIEELKVLGGMDSSLGRTWQLLFQLHAEKGDHFQAYHYLKVAFEATDVSIGDKLKYFTPYFMTLKINPVSRRQAFELSDILLQVYPEDEIPYVVKGDIYNALDSNQKARSYFARAVTKANADYQTWNKLLSLDAKLSDATAQLQHSDAAIERFPNIPGFYLSKAYALLDLGQFRECLSVCDEGLEIALELEDKADLTACKAMAYDELEEYTSSDRYFLQVIQMKPESPLYLNNYAYALAERGVQLDEALKMVNKAIDLEGKLPYYLDTKAWVLFKQGENKAALGLLKEAILLDSNSPEYYEHMAQIYQQQGDLDLVQQLLDKARSLGSTLELK